MESHHGCSSLQKVDEATKINSSGAIDVIVFVHVAFKYFVGLATERNFLTLES
jgi:hypothetical protein